MRALRSNLIVALALGAAACGGNAGAGSGGTGQGSSGSTGASSTGSAATGTGSGGSSGESGASTTGGGTTTTGGGSGGSTGSTVCDSQNCAVFASADHDLYKVDPASPGSATHLCAFGGDLTSSDVVTDIAIAPDLTLYAITTSALYTVDTTPDASGTCAATRKTSISGGTHWVGLTFTAAGLLLGADSPATPPNHVVTIDPNSGAITTVGSFGGALICSGDIVAINDASHTIYATAKDTSCSGSCSDKLVTLDPSNGYAATVVGDTGSSYAVYGLGYWGGKLYGFQHGGATLQIDPASGNTTLLGTGGDHYSGGATTPLAPIFQ